MSLGLILTACGDALLMSSFFGHNHEIVDGGTKNRIFTFLTQYALLSGAFAPLYILFPSVPLTLNIIYYTSIFFAGALSYIASIFHDNQIKRNTGRDDEITKLPYALHNFPQLAKVVHFLNRNLSYPIMALYVISLIACAYAGIGAYVTASILMVIIDQCFQQGFFPTSFKNAYFYVTTYLFIGTFLGFDNHFVTGLNILNVAVAIWDYVQTDIRGVRSATSLFTVANPHNEFSFEKNKGLTPHNQIQLESLLSQIASTDTRVTFNHFRAAITASDKLLRNAPKVNFQDYADFFIRLNFKSTRLRNNIFNEMTVHDKFSEKSYGEQAKDLGLPLDTDLVDIQIAYLKNEMAIMVERLSNPSYRDLNHQQITILQSQARYSLDFLTRNADEKTQENFLLSLAMRTGSHCNRAYLDVFSELSTEYHVCGDKEVTLSLKERAALEAQSVREDCFRKYYYKIMPELRKVNSILRNLWADTNDYHVYESFTNCYGAYFYLRNPSLSLRIRTSFDILLEKIEGAAIKYSSEEYRQFAFSEHYNYQLLEDAVINGKLHSIFMLWCETLLKGSYNKIVLDSFQMVRSNSRKVKALAKLMLLDLGLVEFNEPFIASTLAPLVNENSLQEQRSRSFFLMHKPPLVHTSLISGAQPSLHLNKRLGRQ